MRPRHTHGSRLPAARRGDGRRGGGEGANRAGQRDLPVSVLDEVVEFARGNAELTEVAVKARQQLLSRRD